MMLELLHFISWHEHEFVAPACIPCRCCDGVGLVEYEHIQVLAGCSFQQFLHSSQELVVKGLWSRCCVLG